MEKFKVAVVGANGKMGREVCKILQKDFDIIKIDIENSLILAKNADLVIDFAGADSSVESCRFCESVSIPIIIGSTGQSENQILQIQKFSEKIPVMLCSNFSVGVFLQKQISNLILNSVDADITIFEKHHAEKKDSPSGTAIELQKNINSKSDKLVPILSERGGKEIGTHRIDFYFGDELISVSHSAFSRTAFADGVLIAAKFMITKTEPRQYLFEEAINMQ